MFTWKLGFCEIKEERPKEFIENAKSCEVARNYYDLGLLPDYNKDKNYLQYEWMENKYWHYTTAAFVNKQEGYVPYIYFLGLDYEYEISINDILMVKDKGLFTPVKINLSKFENTEIEISVIFYPIPKKVGAIQGRVEASLSVKPPVGYGWDFHPRLVPTGFYDEVYFKYEPIIKIEDASLEYFIEDDLEKVSGTISILANCENVTIIVSLMDSKNEVAFFKEFISKTVNEVEFTVYNPLLWWCRDHGEQELYTLLVTLQDQKGNVLDSYKKQIGFRKVRLLMNEGAWEEEGFPKTQGKAPITIEINGKRIFAKGTNLVPLEIFYSLVNREKYESILQKIYDCNMNIVRMWGGGIVNKESFFELCDELGIMVWQEFPLACNCYDDNDDYLKVLDKESKSIINRLKKHPSVVLWCGGNELLCSWSGMTNQSHALRLLDKNCFELDRNTPFLMTSPLYGMGHGHYLPLNIQSNEVLSDMVNSDFTAYTEFGMPSPSPLSYLKTFMNENSLYDMSKDSVWDHHHGVSAWSTTCQSWFCIEHIRLYFGEEKTFEELIENGITLQSEVYKNIFEEVRRKFPRASMALNWCFNEPWPCAANNSIVNYPDLPKVAYYSVKKALENLLFSVRFPKMRWVTGEIMVCEIFLLNDLEENGDDFTYSLSLCDLDGIIHSEFEQHNEKWTTDKIRKLRTIEINIDKLLPNTFKLVVNVNSRIQNEYLLFKI